MLAPRLQLFGTFTPDNANAGGSAICIQKDLLLDDAVVTHVVTCQGRYHIVNVRSGRRSLVIVKVHFEPELTLRSLRERLRASRRKDDSMFGIRLSPTVTRERLPYFVYFLTFLRLPNLITPGETPQSMLYARCPGLIERSSIFPWLKRAIFIATSMFLRTWRKISIPSDHAAVRVIQKPTIRGHEGKRIPSWMSKHPVFCAILKRRSPAPCRPIWCTRRFTHYFRKSKKEDRSRALTQNTWQLGSQASDRLDRVTSL